MHGRQQRSAFEHFFSVIFTLPPEEELSVLTDLYLTESGQFEHGLFCEAVGEYVSTLQDPVTASLTDRLVNDFAVAKRLWESVGILLVIRLRTPDSPGAELKNTPLSEDVLIGQIYQLSLPVTEVLMLMLRHDSSATVNSILNTVTQYRHTASLSQQCLSDVFCHKMTERLSMQLLACRIAEGIQHAGNVILLEELAGCLQDEGEARPFVIGLGVDFELGTKTLQSVVHDSVMRDKLIQKVMTRLHQLEQMNETKRSPFWARVHRTNACSLSPSPERKSPTP